MKIKEAIKLFINKLMKPTVYETFKPLKLDLQFFSDGEAEEYQYGGIEGGQEEFIVRGAYNPDEEIEYPQGDNPLWKEDDEPQQFEQFQQEEPPANAPPQPNQQEEYVQQLIQQNQQMQLQMRQMAFMQQQQAQQQFVQPQQQPQIAPPPEPQMSIEERNEKLMEQFYENPTGFFEEMKRQAVEEAKQDFNPIIQERKIESEVSGLMQKYGEDFITHTPQMQHLVTELGDAQVESMGLERVYLMARGMAAQTPQAPQQPQLSADQIFQDQSFIQDYIAQNPAVQQAVMQQMMAQKQQTQPPRVMGTQSAGQPSFAPQHRPKTISEASKLIRQSWAVE